MINEEKINLPKPYSDLWVKISLSSKIIGDFWAAHKKQQATKDPIERWRQNIELLVPFIKSWNIPSEDGAILPVTIEGLMGLPFDLTAIICREVGDRIAKILKEFNKKWRS